MYGLRTSAEEQEAVDTGHSETMHSRHLAGGGDKPATAYNGRALAVDIACLDANGAVDWTVADAQGGIYAAAAQQILASAKQLGIDVQWGGAVVGAWVDGVPSHFRDWGHFQLDPAKYP